MRKPLLFALLTFAVPACSHTLSEKNAEYHEKKAQKDYAKGNYGAAAKQEEKARKAEHEAATAPLP